MKSKAFTFPARSTGHSTETRRSSICVNKSEYDEVKLNRSQQKELQEKTSGRESESETMELLVIRAENETFHEMCGAV